MTILSTKWRGYLAALIGMTLLTGFSPATYAQSITNTGALSLDTNAADPAVFLGFTDNNGFDCLLWNRYYNSVWAWSVETAPGPNVCGPGGSITTGVFATTYSLGSARHYVAFRMNRNGVLLEADDGFTKPRIYTSQYIFGGPGAGAYVVGATTAQNTGGAQPFAFLHTGAALWSSSWNGTAFVWTNHGTPSGVGISLAVGTLAVASGSNAQPYAFVVGSDGNLWSRWWNGSVWSWTSHGSPTPGIASAVGTTIIFSGTRPFIYVIGKDGNLWSRSYSGGWVWYNHGKPSGVNLVNTMGATCGNNCTQPFAFLSGSDGNLWSDSWNGSAWVWTNHGKPAGITLGASIGATAVSNSRPYVFLFGSDGNVWLRYWSGSAWGWYSLGI